MRAYIYILLFLFCFIQAFSQEQDETLSGFINNSRFEEAINYTTRLEYYKSTMQYAEAKGVLENEEIVLKTEQLNI